MILECKSLENADTESKKTVISSTHMGITKKYKS